MKKFTKEIISIIGGSLFAILLLGFFVTLFGQTPEKPHAFEIKVPAIQNISVEKSRHFGQADVGYAIGVAFLNHASEHYYRTKRSDVKYPALASDITTLGVGLALEAFDGANNQYTFEPYFDKHFTQQRVQLLVSTIVINRLIHHIFPETF